MKNFLEEYGFAILAAIVVILIIAMCTPVGNLIKRQVMNIVDSFAGKSESKLAAVDAGEDSVLIKQCAVGEIEVTVTSNSTTDKFDVQYRVKADKSAWQNWTVLGDGDLINNESKQHTEKFSITAQDGYSVQVRAKDKGKNDKHFIESNVIRYKANIVSNNNSSEEASTSQTNLNEAIANLNDNERLIVYRGNGGLWPNGEDLIFAKVAIDTNTMDETFVSSYPSFNNHAEFRDYAEQVSRSGFDLDDFIEDYQGLSESEFHNKVLNGDIKVMYIDLVWEEPISISENQFADYPEEDFINEIENMGMNVIHDESLDQWINYEDFDIPRIISHSFGKFYTGDNVYYGLTKQGEPQE